MDTFQFGGLVQMDDLTLFVRFFSDIVSQAFGHQNFLPDRLGCETVS
jgi:hypothetical protein